MANSHFQFKQFTVWQDRCAMKVGTLSCILGAHVSPADPQRILDVGSGTGLLSLMLAQRFEKAEIDAIEIEDSAYRQASSNVQKSKWKDRIKVVHGDFLHWKASPYDLVVSNPPFFENNLKSPDRKINLARHNDRLPLPSLVEKVIQLLSENGLFYVLLPPFEMKRLEKFALERGLYLAEKFDVQNYPNQPPKACIYAFSLSKSEMLNKRLIIRNPDNSYTSEFMALLKAFYLHF